MEKQEPESQRAVERQYTGQVSDTPQTGLYYYNARYYSPQIALFTQADNIEGPNRYIYALGNPLKYIDPTGQQISFSEVGYGIYSPPEYISLEPPLSINTTPIFASSVYSPDSTAFYDLSINSVDYQISIDSINFYQNDHVYIVDYTEEWFFAQRGLLAESIRKLPVHFRTNYTYLLKDNSINFENGALAVSNCENSSTCQITLRNKAFDDLDETIFHEFIHIMVGVSGKASASLINLTGAKRPETGKPVYISLALIDFMNAAGYYYWDEKKQKYQAPSKMYYSVGAKESAGVDPHEEEITYMGSLYAKDSLAFRQEFGQDLFTFYYNFFGQSIYYQYQAYTPILEKD